MPAGSKPDDLRRLFEKFGIVTECDIMNRCGFVHMQTQEMADIAIQNLNNSLFNGANIVVERGRMKDRKPGGPGGNMGGNVGPNKPQNNNGRMNNNNNNNNNNGGPGGNRGAMGNNRGGMGGNNRGNMAGNRGPNNNVGGQMSGNNGGFRGNEQKRFGFRMQGDRHGGTRGSNLFCLFFDVSFTDFFICLLISNYLN